MSLTGRVLVLGASGFIGRWVARRLDATSELHVAARDTRLLLDVAARFGFGGTVHALDVSRPGAAASLVAGLMPDTVFNLAGYGVDRSEHNPAEAERLNARLPEELALALAQLRGSRVVRLVHIGSALEYGEIGGDLGEDSLPNPTTLYGKTKLEGTLATVRVSRERSVAAVTARLFTVFGPGEHEGRLFPTLMTAASGHDRVPLSPGLQKRDFTYVEDAAAAIVALGSARWKPGEIVNLATGRLTRVRDFAETVAKELGIEYSRLDFGAIGVRAEEMEHEPVRVSRLEQLVGWTPSDDLARGVRRAIQFLRD